MQLPTGNFDSSRWWWIPGAALVILFAAYQPPVTWALARLLPLFLAAVAVLALAGLGGPVARRLVDDDRWLQLLTATAVGTGLTGVLSLILGFAGWFDARIYAAWFTLGLVALGRDLWRAWPLPPVRIKTTRWNVFALAVIAASVLPQLPFVVAPVASKDSLQYHLLIPQIYLAQGHISRIPLLVEASYPSLAEYNYLPLLLLADDITCKAWHFWMTMLTLVAIGRLAAAVAPDQGRLLAPALFLAMPITLVHMGWAWNDFLFTLLLLIALLFLHRYHLTEPALRRGRDLLAAGLMVGLASWTKYTFVLFFLALLPLLAIGIRRWGWQWRHAFWLFVGIGVVCPWWLGQNFYLTDNPFYPFLHRVFPSPYWTDNADRVFHEALRRYEIEHWQWTTYFTFPLHIVLKPRIIEANTGIVPLLLLPLVFGRRRNPGLRLLQTYLACFMLAWVLIQTENRSMLSVFAALMVLGAEVLQRRAGAGSVRTVAVLAAALVLGYCVALVPLQHLMDPVDYFIGRESKESYLLRIADSQPTYDFLNQRTDVTGALLVSLHGPYYLDKPYLFSSFADPPIAEVAIAGATNPADMARALRGIGVSHVVVDTHLYEQEHRLGNYTWSTEQRAGFERLLQSGATRVARFGDDVVYQLAPD